MKKLRMSDDDAERFFSVYRLSVEVEGQKVTAKDKKVWPVSKQVKTATKKVATVPQDLDRLAEFYSAEMRKPEKHNRKTGEYRSNRVSPFGEFNIDALLAAVETLRASERSRIAKIADPSRQDGAANEVYNR